MDFAQFASFVRKHKLAELAEEELRFFKSFDLPLLSMYVKLDHKELVQLTMQNLEAFLTSVENGTALDMAKENLVRWQKNEIPNLDKGSVTLTDITTIYSGQKYALCSLILEFTKDARTISELIKEIDIYYATVQQMAVSMLEQIQKDQLNDLLESEDKYRDLFDNANDLVHFASPPGMLLYVNNAWLKTLGYSQEDVKGKDVHDIVHEKDRERFKAYRNSIIEGLSQSMPVTFTILAKNGKEIIVEGFITCKFRDGIPQYTRAILRDITLRVNNEQKLQYYTKAVEERENNIRQLLQNGPDAVIVINQSGRITFWNNQAEKIFGWQSEEVIGTLLVDNIIPPQYREAHVAGMNRLMQTGEIRVLNKTIEITALKKSGEEFYISLTISRSLQSGETIFIAFLRDITAQKESEFKIEAQKIQLEKSNQELEQYAWLASHDLKEPLRKILTFSDMLNTRHNAEFKGPALKLLEKIMQSARRMNSLIEDLLMYSNVSKPSEHFELVDLNKVVSEVQTDLEIQIKNTQAKIKIDKLPVIEAVPIHMRQLFQNLLSNAMKYSKPEEKPLIIIKNKNLNDNFCEISVSDNGIGFENVFADKIFQVFQRLEKHNRYEGTGIGLALCKKIVEAHHGSIRAESNPGKGAIFSFILPFHQPPNDVQHE